MFRFLVQKLGVPMQDISQLHPTIIEALLEHCWNRRLHDTTVPVGHPDRRSDVPGRPDALVAPALAFQVPRIAGGGSINVPQIVAGINQPPKLPLGNNIQWHHLIYAYMIENTRVLEVFRRVIDAFVHGERLSTLTPVSQRWLWTAEELFFRDPPSFSSLTQTSQVRPSTAATRANAHLRLFGMTLNPVDGNKTPFTVAEHANTDFVQVFDELLHEIWQGRSNFANAAGARPTDDSKIAELATRLCDMFRSRRVDGTLSREEFMAVATLSWFHATLMDDTHPIIVDLRAQANSPEERLFKIAQRVGFAAHGLTKSYFELAEPLSRLLIGIEQGTYRDVLAVPALYTPSPPAPADGPASDNDLILTHWSIIRGRDAKAKKLVA